LRPPKALHPQTVLAMMPLPTPRQAMPTKADVQQPHRRASSDSYSL
jgi:hypothetical protein